jgi:hypothetical protein
MTNRGRLLTEKQQRAPGPNIAFAKSLCISLVIVRAANLATWWMLRWLQGVLTGIKFGRTDSRIALVTV